MHSVSSDAHGYVVCLQNEIGDYAIGDRRPGGGIVFWLDPASVGGDGRGTAELEAAPVELNTSTEWGCWNTDIVGAAGLVVGTGEQNTLDILAPAPAGCDTRPIAASVADDYELSGYSDWFLPSFDQLLLMVNNLHRASLGEFIDGGFYWSSSETSSERAWTTKFSSSGPIFSGQHLKYESNWLRPVRAF
jgi:hypothetical protein